MFSSTVWHNKLTWLSKYFNHVFLILYIYLFINVIICKIKWFFFHWLFNERMSTLFSLEAPIGSPSFLPDIPKAWDNVSSNMFWKIKYFYRQWSKQKRMFQKFACQFQSLKFDSPLFPFLVSSFCTSVAPISALLTSWANDIGSSAWTLTVLFSEACQNKKKNSMYILHNIILYVHLIP